MDHDERVKQLIEANSREVERRRAAENTLRKIEQLCINPSFKIIKEHFEKYRNFHS